jgi:hypothetical protein
MSGQPGQVWCYWVPAVWHFGKTRQKRTYAALEGVPTHAARGRRNRTKGDAKARRARKKLGLGGHLTRHEENWGGYFRTEVKAGAQVGPIATRFQAAYAQSLAAKALGDIRPFIMVAMPDGTAKGIVLMDLEEFSEIAILLQQIES